MGRYQICPECGAIEFGESTICPRHGGEMVCMDCCRSCEYHQKDSTGGAVMSKRCTWGDHPYNLERDKMMIEKLREILR